MEGNELNKGLYELIYRIRYAEEVIQREYHKDEMKTPMHMSMGSEAIAAGICSALERTDQVLGTYRSHALYLAKTNDTKGFFAEMFGKETGIAKGKAGSMHLSSPEHGLMCCSAIVGSTIPVATGIAWANKLQKTDKVTAVFFGDGAVGTGAFWESFNFACANKLPVIFVCERNELVVHTRPEDISGYDNLVEVAGKFNCRTYSSNTTDVEEIHHMGKTIVKDMKADPMPAVVGLRYHRYLEHVGIGEDYDDGYRKYSEYDEWKKLDPVSIQRDKLLMNNKCSQDELSAMEEEIKEEVEASILFARESKFADKEELYRGVFK